MANNPNLYNFLDHPLWDPAPEIWQMFQDRFTQEDKIQLMRAQIAASRATMTSQLQYLTEVEKVLEKYMG